MLTAIYSEHGSVNSETMVSVAFQLLRSKNINGKLCLLRLDIEYLLVKKVNATCFYHHIKPNYAMVWFQ